MPTIHVHGSRGEYTVYGRGVSKSWVDATASLRSLYADLEARMMRCLRDTQAGTADHRGLQHVSIWLEEAAHISPAIMEALTRDDVHGHEFHGNQHTGGISGPHKAKHEHVAHVKSQLELKKIKSAKMAVHALLSSGHPFSKDELAIAVGMDPQGKTINDYLTNLKSPKYAGPQGALAIEKNKEGHFYVALPDGTPAPPPDVKMDWSEKKDIEFTDIPQKQWTGGLPPHLQKFAGPQHTVSEVHVPGFTEPPVEVPHVEEPTAVVKQSHLDVMMGAHPGSMPKSEADKLYKEHIDQAYATMKDDLKEMSADLAVWEFKVQKAKGMAAWATAVHGHPFKENDLIKIHKADWQLAKDVKDFSQEAALNNWKANTAAEKAGNFPKKTVPNVTMTPVHPSNAELMAQAKAAQAAHAATVLADMGHPAPVKPLDYTSLSKGVQIDASDITAGKFSEGIEQTKQLFQSEAQSQASSQKKEVEHRLRERLADKPNFQALVKRLGLAKEGFGSLEAKLVSAWAGSSGDTHDISVALQMAAKDAFAIPDKHIEKKALKSLKNHEDLDALTSSGIHSLNPNMTKLKPHEAATARAALQEFVQAQYHETQELLKDKGLTHVYLARGMHVKADHENNKQGTSKLKLQPASSFSVDYSTAKSFGHGGTVFVSRVPREQILSTYLTGFGCMGEHEVVVLAHENTRAYTVPSNVYGSSAAQTYLTQHIEGKEAYS